MLSSLCWTRNFPLGIGPASVPGNAHGVPQLWPRCRPSSLAAGRDSLGCMTAIAVERHSLQSTDGMHQGPESEITTRLDWDGSLRR